MAHFVFCVPSVRLLLMAARSECANIGLTMNTTKFDMVLLLLIALWIGSVMPTIAQEKPIWRHEIIMSVSSGKMTDHSYCNWRNETKAAQHLGKMYESKLSFDDLDTRFNKTLAYFYHFNQYWAVGVMIGNANTNDEFHHWQPDDEKYVERWGQSEVGRFHSYAWYLLPTCKWYWHATRVVRLYSKVGLGAYWQRSSLHTNYDNTYLHNTIVRPTYQFTPFGIEFGRREVSFIMELGYGIQNILGIGLSYHFGSRLPTTTDKKEKSKQAKN